MSDQANNPDSGATRAAPPSQSGGGAPPGTGHQQKINVVGGFEVISKIGQGAMGAVFKARQKSLDRIVALKVLPPSIAKDTKFIERFQREARASAKLNHPNIVQGIDVGKDAATNLWYFAMELVDGPTLQKVLNEKKTLPEKEALRYIRDVADALTAVAANGMVHRDIKPDNILINSRGETKLADLGLAKQTNDDASLTQSGKAVGTPYYMAPEQVRGETDNIDIRTDIYALGGTLFHLVVGHPPFEGPTGAVIMSKHLIEAPPKASKANPQVSEACSRLIDRMLQKKKEQRVQTPQDLIQQIDKVLKAEPAGDRPATQQHARVTERHASVNPAKPKSNSMLMAGAAVLVLVIAVVALRKGSGAQNPSETKPESKQVAAVENKTPEKKKTPPSDPKNKSASTQQNTAPIAKPPVVASVGDPEQLLKQALEFEQKNPESYDEAIQHYQRAAQAAKGTPLEQSIDDKAEDAIAGLQRRQTAAVESAWKTIDQAVTDALATGDYDAALAACSNLPPKLANALKVKADEKATAIHQEAEAKVIAITRKVETLSADAEPTEALKVLADAEIIKYSPTKGIISTLKARLTSEQANEAELRQKKQLLVAEKKMEEIFKKYDAAVLPDDKGQQNLKAALEVVAEAKNDSALQVVAPRIKAMEDLVNAYDQMAKQAQEGLAKLKGQKVELETKTGKQSGTVAGIQDGVISLEILFPGGGIGKKSVKIADLTDEQRKKFSGDVVAQNDAQRVATAISKLGKGKEDIPGAVALLAQSSEFPIAAHFQEMIQNRQVEAAKAAAEALAPALFGEIQLRSSQTKISETESKALLEKIAKYERECSETQFFAANKEKLASIKEKLNNTGGINLVVNGDFETGSLQGWEVQDGSKLSKVDVFTAQSHEGKACAKMTTHGDVRLSQTIPVEPGATYKMNLWVKALRGEGEVRIRAFAHEGKNRLANPTIETTAPFNEWRQLESTFTPTLSSVRLDFFVRINSGNEWEVLMDDFKVTKQGGSVVQAASIPPAIVPPNLTSHGMIFWVSPFADPAGTSRELVSNGAAKEHEAQIQGDANSKFMHFQRAWCDYIASDAVANVERTGSVVVWIRGESYDYWGGILNRGDGPKDDFSVWVDRGCFAAYFNWPENRYGRAAEGKGYFYSKSKLKLNKWNCCGVTWDGSNVTIYMNGERDNSYAYAGVPLKRSRVVSIGSNPPGGHEFFSGDIAGVMIYNKCLSDGEMRYLFDNGQSLRAK